MTGSEFLIGAAAEGIAALITDTTKVSSSNAFVNTVKGIREKSKQAIFGASRKYIETYQKRHCQLKVLGMREPVDLASVYTGVKLLDSRDILQFDPDALEETFRQDRLRGYSGRGREEKKQSGIDIANQKQYLMVLGGPGAGKSTFLRKVGLEALRTFYYEKADYRPRVIPVLLELKRFEASDVDIARFIAAEFETCGFPEPEAFMQNALTQGNLLIMLDGLDEVPSANLNNVLKTIRDFVDRYDENRFIASCRIAAAGYRGSAFTRFSNVTMADFDDEQIQQFIGNWFCSEQNVQMKTAQRCWEVLQKPENKASKEIAHTPLLLTYLCLVYSRSQRFPSNRSILYRKALRILLEEWAAEKEILTKDIYEGLSIEQEEILLSEIAYNGMTNDQLFFDKRWLSAQIRNFLSSNLNAPKGLDSEKVLNAIEVQQGILVERTEDQYSFSHLTLQEYLAAQYSVDNDEWKELIEEHITDNRWREIFLLLPGLMPGKAKVDRLLLAMEAQANRCLQSQKLQALLQWVDIATQSSAGESKQPAKRAAALFLALDLTRALDLARARARGLAFFPPPDFDITHALALAHALNIDLVRKRVFTLELDIDIDITYALNLFRDFSRTDVFSDIDFDRLIELSEVLAASNLRESTACAEKQTFVEKTYGPWFLALGIETETALLSLEESQVLADYLYICELMVRCKEGAVRVSPEVWEDIESRILTVPDSVELQANAYV